MNVKKTQTASALGIDNDDNDASLSKGNVHHDESVQWPISPTKKVNDKEV